MGINIVNQDWCMWTNWKTFSKNSFLFFFIVHIALKKCITLLSLCKRCMMLKKYRNFSSPQIDSIFSKQSLAVKRDWSHLCRLYGLCPPDSDRSVWALLMRRQPAIFNAMHVNITSKPVTFAFIFLWQFQSWINTSMYMWNTLFRSWNCHYFVGFSLFKGCSS